MRGVSDAFKQVGLPWAEFIIAAGRRGRHHVGAAGDDAVSQPRVLLAMARDGLVPTSFFGDVHPKFRTPWKSTILIGVFVAVLAGFLPIERAARHDQHRHAVRLRRSCAGRC